MSENPRILDSTFEHEQSSHLVYCRKGYESSCNKVFVGGESNTVISLPPNIGSGPVARLIKMERVSSIELPKHHIYKRSVDESITAVYNLTFDYSFEEIDPSHGVIDMRIDYTNVRGYWELVTGPKSSKGVGSAVRRNIRNTLWWGSFKEWLARVTLLEHKEAGKLPLGIKKHFLLYQRRIGCPRGKSIVQGGLEVTADLNADMNARWAYYASGTLVPPRMNNTYAFFGLEPQASIIMTVDGSVTLRYKSERIQIMDPIGYPGLQIKGILAIGPTLSLWYVFI